MIISTFNIQDYVQLLGHYTKLKSGPTIDPRLLDRYANDPKRLDLIKQQMEKKTPKRHKALNVIFKKPIENFNYDQFAYVYTLYIQYQKGVNPFQGPLADQPAQIMEIFNTLSALEHEEQQRIMRENKNNEQRNKRK